MSESVAGQRSNAQFSFDSGNLGDRVAGFTVCLPAEPTGCVVAIASELVSHALLLRYPEAILLGSDKTLPIPAPQSIGLLVLEEREIGDRDLMTAIAPLLCPQAVIATLGSDGQFLIYPTLDHPEQLWRRGWPFPAGQGAITRIRRNAGLLSASRRGVPSLNLTGARCESLADRIAAELGLQLGFSLTLVGVITAGHTILRLSGDEVSDVAVRLSFDRPLADLVMDPRIVEEVPAIAAYVAEDLGTGITCGYHWSATRWVPGRPASLVRVLSSRGDRIAVVREVVDILTASPTGRTSPGWAKAWIDRAALLTPHARCRFVQALSQLEAGVRTGWCHGDLWAGNVLMDGGRGVVIDWDLARDDAPLGLDSLLVEMMMLERRSEDIGFVQAGIRLVDDVAAELIIGDKIWRDWNREVRVAFVFAAYLIQLSNRSLHDLGTERLNDDVGLLLDLLDDADPQVASTAAIEPDVRSQTIRGAGWLGIGAGVAKISQTVVLLVLAALLAPSAMGILAIGALVLNISSALTDLGSSTALVYWRGDAERAARSALTVALTFALVLTGTMWVLAPWLSSALNAGNDGTGVIRGLMFCLPFTAVSGVSGELLRRTLQFKLRVVPDIFGALVGTAVSIVLVFEGYGVYSLVIGQLVASALTVVLFWIIRAPVRPGWRSRDVAGLISYGGHLAGANILQLVMLNLDYLIVARVLGTNPLGVYSMAFRLAYMPYLLVSVVICGAAFAHLCRLRGRHVGEAASDLAVTLIALVTPLYLGMALFAPQLELLGVKWAPGVAGLRWLAVYGLILSLVQVCLVTLNAVSRTRQTMMLNLLHLFLLAALLMWWAQFGVTMVAIGQVVAALGMLVAALLMVRRNVSGLEFRRHIPRLTTIAAAIALMGSVTFTLQQVMPWARISVPGLFLIGLLGLAVYAVPFLLAQRQAKVTLNELIGRKS